jgi:hypothetical protein
VIVTVAGTVRATVIDRGVDNNPSLQPLPLTRVSIVRGAQTLFTSAPSDGNGHYTIDGVTNLEAGDQIAIELSNDHVVIEDRNGTGAADPCLNTPMARRLLSLPTGWPKDVEWPIEVDGFSGEAVNLHYWNERAFLDYWQAQLGLAATDRNPLHSIVRYPIADGRYWVCSSYYVTLLGKKYAYCRSAIVHEFAHSVLHRQAGLAELPLGSNAHPAAGPIDEAVADYFTAAWSGNTEIFPRLWVGNVPMALRNITSRRMMPACNGEFVSTGNRYNDALVLVGALWDWRLRLVNDRAMIPAQVDLAVLEALTAICRPQHPPAERDFLAFRTALAATTLGHGLPDDLAWAFDRHNIKDPPDETCPHIPSLGVTRDDVDAQGRHVDLAWSPTPDAIAYRLYVRRWSSESTGLGLGEVVADSITATSFSYLQSDTAEVLAFVVAVLDSAGEEQAASQETPLVTAVPPGGSQASNRVLHAFPNPSRDAMWVAFGDAVSGRIVIEIHDVSGRRIRREQMVVGRERQWLWDGRDGTGRRLGGGIYLIRLTSEKAKSSTRVVLVR